MAKQKVTKLHARLLKFTKKFVDIDVIIDREKGIFEVREFPAFLFSDFPKNFKESYILKITEQPGITSIEVTLSPDNKIWDSFDKEWEQTLKDLGPIFEKLNKPLKYD